MAAVTIAFRGVTRRGVAMTGRRAVEDVGRFVKDRYDAGWQRLAVFRALPDVEQVGAIGAVDGRRTWWAEG